MWLCNFVGLALKGLDLQVLALFVNKFVILILFTFLDTYCFAMVVKQGRIHCYPSCMGVSRGSDEEGHLGIWVGAVS